MAPYCCIVFQDDTESGSGEVSLCWIKKSGIPKWIIELFKLFNHDICFNVESGMDWDDKKKDLHENLLNWAWAGSSNILRNTINPGQQKRHQGVVFYWRLRLSYEEEEMDSCFDTMTDADVSYLYDMMI